MWWLGSSSLLKNEIGISVVDLLVRSGLCKSKGEARRSIKQDAVKLSDTKITDSSARLALLGDRFILVESE